MKKIPKKIHYCWFGNGEFSPLVKDCFKSWEKYLSDFEIIKWDENNSPMNHPMVIKAIEHKQYAFAADYTRMYVLYEQGGIYLDTDMEIIKDINPLLNQEGFLGYEDEKWINVAIIGLAPKSKLTKTVLDIFDERMRKNKRFNKPLPKIVTEAINKLQKANELGNIKLYKSEYFYPYNPFIRGKNRKQLMFSDITENTYAIHHWEGSWMKEPSLWKRIKDKVRNKFY